MRIVSMIAAVASLSMQASGPLTVLASGAVEGSLVALRQDLPPSTYQFATSQDIVRRLASGDIPDVLIAQAATIQQAVDNGAAVRDSRASIGRIPIGVAIGRGVRPPDLSTVDTLRAAILGANAVVISQGASGAFLEKVFADIGVADRIRDKIVRQPRGDDVMKRLAEGRGNEIGFTMASEIRYGERHGAMSAGLLPRAVQSYTQYDAVVMTATRNQTAARAFVRTVTGPAARKVLATDGWEF
jgi:molybdate transport system substrate-binding protein